MKATIILTAIVALALNTQTVTADNVATFSIGTSEVRMQTTQSKLLNINVGNTQKDEVVHIQIQNDANEVIFSDCFIGANLYARRYNMDELAIGEYNVIIEKDAVKAIHSIRIHRKGISVGEKANRLVFKPIIEQEGDLLKLQVTLDEPEQIKVSFINTDNSVIFTQKYRNVDTFTKTYNLAEMPAGTYTVKIEMPDNTATQSITVKH